MISAFIITKNEASGIERCIRSVLPVADEIVVMDSGSTDNTAQLARDLGAKVLQTEWKGYAQTKNEGHSVCLFDYILSIDADEVLTEDLARHIVKEKEKGLKGAYLLDRHNYYLGKWIKSCGWYPDWKIRLFNRHEARWTGDFVHEKLEVETSVIKQKIVGELSHYSIGSVEQHRDTVHKYAMLAARKRLAQDKPGYLVIGAVAFLTTFLRIYFLKAGFSDGRRGLLIAYYSALSKWLRFRFMNRIRKEKN